MELSKWPDGGYGYIPAVLQFSGGVIALPGYSIERVCFSKLVPLPEGFERIKQYLNERARPLTSLCACELRSPAQFSQQAFTVFNKGYLSILQSWGLFDGTTNPVARSNVCPEHAPPEEPGLHAFSFTREERSDYALVPSFVVAGSAEVTEGIGNYKEHIVALGDHGTEGMRSKARFVISEIERRLAALGVAWADTTATQIYTVFDLHGHLEEEIVKRGAARNGAIWHLCRPPLEGLEYEVDCRGVGTEHVMKV